MPDEKDFIDLVDFQKMVDELEKISYEAEVGSVRNNFQKLSVESERQAAEDLNKTFYKAVEKGLETLNGVPSPLTIEESKSFDDKHESAVREVELIKRKIGYAKKLLIKEIEKEKGYDMALENRGNIRKISKRFYGTKKDSISYEDYLKAREVRDSFNKEEAFSFFSDEDEE
jgi:hypothetical protein